MRALAWLRSMVVRVAIIGLVGGVGCSASGDDLVDIHLRVIVPDGHIRQEGVECAGARPFQFVHAKARYVVETQDGSMLAEGELPAGRAVNADPSIDWDVEKIPTFCVTELDVLDLPKQRRYQLRLEEGRALEFGPATGSENDRIALLVQ